MFLFVYVKVYIYNMYIYKLYIYIYKKNNYVKKKEFLK